jgi:hypothetical protein
MMNDYPPKGFSLLITEVNLPSKLSGSQELRAYEFIGELNIILKKYNFSLGETVDLIDNGTGQQLGYIENTSLSAGFPVQFIDSL